ncbi:MAG: 7TM diverse intracellular signaling domain-containing protein [Pseudomonadota bacterium]|nr:7TM diverse intracellular signaling domain-containing protein [Pseudomonadota bacterium]
MLGTGIFLKSLSFLLTILLVSVSHASPSVNLEDLAFADHGDRYFSHLEDASSSLTIDGLLEQTYDDLFTPGTDEALNKGYSSSAFWLHGRFHLNSDAPQSTRFFALEYSLLDEVEFYVVRDGKLVQQWLTGDARHFDTRPMDHTWFIFPVDFQAAEPLDIYIRVKSTSSLRMPIRIWEPSAFYNQQRPRLLTEGTYFGILFLMFFYNFCLLATVRDISYFYYIAYIFSLGTFQLCMTGYGFEYIWPEHPRINEFMLPFSVSAVGLFIVAFGIRVMDLQRNSQLMYYMCCMLLVLEAASALVSLVLPYEVVIRTVIALALFVSAIMLVTSVQESLKGNSTAKLFLLAYFTLLGGGVALAFASMGWLPANFLTTNSFMIGSTVEIVVLSFALAERLNQINKEKAKSEREAKHYLEEMNDYLRQTNLLKDDFLATISHELRTPMNGVLGCLQHLQHGGHAESSNPYLNFADRSARQMMMMVDSLLAYTELQSGKLSIQNEPLKIHELVDRSHKLFIDSCKKKGIQLSVSIDENTPLILFGDPERLCQVLNNLLDNAVKFTHEGQIDVQLSSSAIQPESRLLQLEVRVSDTGIGVEADKQEQLFETFRRGDGNIKRGYGGLGIGLSVVKSLLDKMGGSISFVSQPGIGSTFTISLPCHYQTNELTERYNEHFKARQPQLKTLTVLVVEDNPVNQLVVKGLLKKYGYEVVSASNGAEALEKLERHRINLVLMDCQMPIMDGFETTRRIRNSDADYRNIPIIAVTANAMSEDRHLCIQAGMNDYLCKPIDAQILNRKVMYWANRPSQTRAAM